MTAVFAPLVFIVFIGALLRLRNPQMEDVRRAMNRLVLVVFLPALVFRTVMETNLDRLFYEIPLAAATGIVGCLLVSLMVFHFLPIPGRTKGAMVLGASFGNVTYLGLPVLLETFPNASEQVSEVSVLFEVTKSSINLTVGAMIAIHYGSREAITFRKTAFEAFKLPPIWGLFLAILFKVNGIPCPAFLQEATHILASAVSGLMVLSLGMAFHFRASRLFWLVIPVSAIKLILSPLLMARVVSWYNIAGVYADAAILEAAMPSQLLSFVISSRFELDEETLAVVILLDTLLAFLSIPLIGKYMVPG